MNKSLATFMMIAVTALVMVSLILGIAFDALHEKNTQHEDMLKMQHQIKLK